MFSAEPSGLAVPRWHRPFLENCFTDISLTSVNNQCGLTEPRDLTRVIGPPNNPEIQFESILRGAGKSRRIEAFFLGKVPSPGFDYLGW